MCVVNSIAVSVSFFPDFGFEGSTSFPHFVPYIPTYRNISLIITKSIHLRPQPSLLPSCLALGDIRYHSQVCHLHLPLYFFCSLFIFCLFALHIRQCLNFYQSHYCYFLFTSISFLISIKSGLCMRITSSHNLLTMQRIYSGPFHEQGK